MAWVKIDDNFAQHPKIAQVGPLGMAMQIAALCYCNRLMTDGFIPKRVASTLLALDGIAVGRGDNEAAVRVKDATVVMIVDI